MARFYSRKTSRLDEKSVSAQNGPCWTNVTVILAPIFSKSGHAVSAVSAATPLAATINPS
jgi:hypothetical protein